MASRQFKVVIKTPGHEGADLSSLINRLKAIERLFHATGSAILRPGASRSSIPKKAEELARLTVLEATRSGSLTVVISEPELPVGYEGDYGALPEQIGRRFSQTLRAAASRRSADIVQLFPEKADLVRILKEVEALSPREGEPSTVVKGMRGASGAITFSTEHRLWARREMPSLAPERLTIRGILKRAALSAHPLFALFDGSRSVILRPELHQTQDLRDLFGRVVEVTGTAYYQPTGAIKHIENIRYVRPYTYKTKKLTTDDRVFVLRRELQYEIESSVDARDFILHNEELDSYSFGGTLPDAEALAAKDFAALWDEIAVASKEDLHETALDLRRELKKLVRQVRLVADGD